MGNQVPRAELQKSMKKVKQSLDDIEYDLRSNDPTYSNHKFYIEKYKHEIKEIENLYYGQFREIDSLHNPSVRRGGKHYIRRNTKKSSRKKHSRNL